MTDHLAGAAANRRQFLTIVGLGTAAVAGGPLLAACSKEAGSRGTATQADAIQAVLPAHRPMELLKADIQGTGPIPDGYLTYPTNLVDAIKDKPGTSGKTIKTMAPWWGPTPPPLGRNSYVEAVNTELGVPIDASLLDGNTYADKLSAVLGARDVPDLLVAPNWEVDKIARFSDAVKALFEDLTDYLKGDAVNAYPMLATLPTGAWEYSVWGGRLAAVPFPTDGPFALAMFYRKDLADAAGLAAPNTIDALYDFGKRATDAGKGVWAFGSVFDLVQQYYGCPNVQNGWRRRPDGSLEHKYELPEYRQALEFTARLFKEGLVHPDTVASKGADEKQLLKSGKILMYRDGVGAWKGMQSEQTKVLPTFNMQPLPMFSAVAGKDPVVWGTEKPIFWTFVKKGLGKERTEELLRVLNWLAAPFGTQEYQLREYGVDGKHFGRGPDGSPNPTELGRKELGSQYSFLSGRVPAVVRTADTPNYVKDLLDYSNATIRYLEKEFTAGIKLELPANYSKVTVPTEDKILDILRGRRPLGDMDQVVKEWRGGGGDEGRAFIEKALADNGR